MNIIWGLVALSSIALIAAAYAAVQHGLWLLGERLKAWLAARLGVEYEPQKLPQLFGGGRD